MATSAFPFITQTHPGYLSRGTRRRKSAERRSTILPTTRVMLAGSAPLNGIVTELLDGWPEFEVVASEQAVRGLARKAARLAPDVIIACIRPIGTGVRRTVESIRRSNPRSRIIVICAGRDLMDDARRYGADAYVDQERITAGLLRAVKSVIAPSRLTPGVSQPKSYTAGAFLF